MVKTMAILVVALSLAGCGTIKGTAGGFFEGAAEDFKTVGKIIKE